MGGQHTAQRATHIGLANAIYLKRSLKWQRLAREIQAAEQDRTMLSVEDFAHPWCSQRAPARLAELTARETLEVEVLACVRPQ